MNSVWDNFETLDVLGIEIEDGEQRLKLGHAEKEIGVHAKAFPWGQTGVVAIPDPPDADGACVALCATDGAHASVWHTYDARYADKVGALPAGTRGFITRGEARMLLNPEREQVTSYTLANGKVMMVDLDGTTGALTIMVDDKVFQIDQATDSIKLVVGSNFVEIGKNGINVSAGALNLVGAVDLGGDGATPGDKVALNSYVLAELGKIATAITGVGGSYTPAVNVGSSTVTAKL